MPKRQRFANASLQRWNLPLGPEIYKVTGLPVFIANDTRVWALAERLFGHSRDKENSVLISIHHGLGAGIADGRVLQGGTAISENWSYPD